MFVFWYLGMLALISYFIDALIFSTLSFVAVVLPVVMISMSMIPVLGSVAACWVADFTKRKASSTSSMVT